MTTRTALAMAEREPRPSYGVRLLFWRSSSVSIMKQHQATADDRSRFQDARGLKAYAGAAPITRASGKTRSVTRRRVKNNRLNAAGYLWAFSALTASPGARAHYDRRRNDGDRHAAAQRNLFGRLLGCLHHCLATGQHYNETTAFPTQAAPPTAA